MTQRAIFNSSNTVNNCFPYTQTIIIVQFISTDISSITPNERQNTLNPIAINQNTYTKIQPKLTTVHNFLSTVSPTLPLADIVRERRQQDSERTRRTSSSTASTANEGQREAVPRARCVRPSRDCHREVSSVCSIEPPDPVFVSSSAALLALQKIKEASM